MKKKGAFLPLILTIAAIAYLAVMFISQQLILIYIFLLLVSLPFLLRALETLYLMISRGRGTEPSASIARIFSAGLICLALDILFAFNTGWVLNGVHAVLKNNARSGPFFTALWLVFFFILCFLGLTYSIAFITNLSGRLSSRHKRKTSIEVEIIEIEHHE